MTARAWFPVSVGLVASAFLAGALSLAAASDPSPTPTVPFSATPSGIPTDGNSAPPLPATTLTLRAGRTELPADGHTFTRLKAFVSNELGEPVVGDFILFSTTDFGETISNVVDLGNGTYTATLTASRAIETVSVSATDVSVPTIPHAAIALRQTVPVASRIEITASTPKLQADGTATTTLTAHVTNSIGQAISGHTLLFWSSDSGERFGLVSDTGTGDYTVTLTASRHIGSATITATDASVPTVTNGTVVITQLPRIVKTRFDSGNAVLVGLVTLIAAACLAVALRRILTWRVPR